MVPITLGNIALFTNAIMGAVLFTLAFLTGNTLRQSLQDRAREFAILKTTGFSGTVTFQYEDANFTDADYADIESASLHHGDELQIGKFRLVFLSGMGG